MDIIKIIRIKFSSFEKKIIISEIQIPHPQLIFCGFTKKKSRAQFLKNHKIAGLKTQGR